MMIPNASERAAIDRYLHENGPWGNVHAVSSFVAAVRDARRLAGRDVDTGKLRTDIEDAARTDFAAVFLHLAAIEQVGRVLRRTGARDRAARDNNNDLMHALRLWKPTIRASHADALRALRNALAHNFGLAALDERRARRGGTPPPGGWRHYLFAVGDAGPLVVLPNRRWNGKYGDDRLGGVTHVNHLAVGDVVEDVVRALDDAQKRNELRLRVHPDEVKLRFGFTIIQHV